MSRVGHILQKPPWIISVLGVLCFVPFHTNIIRLPYEIACVIKSHRTVSSCNNDFDEMTTFLSQLDTTEIKSITLIVSRTSLIGPFEYQRPLIGEDVPGA